MLANFFSGAGPTGWTTYSFDVSSYLSPGTYTLRFAEADNVNYFQMGVDDVSIRGPADVVPEPGTLSLFGFGAVGLAGFRRRRRRA